MSVLGSLEAVGWLPQKVLAILIAYVILRKTVIIGSQEEQYRERNSGLPNLYLGSIWGVLALIVLLWEYLTKIFSGDLFQWLREQIAFFSQLPPVQAVENMIVKIGSWPLIEPVINYLFPVPPPIVDAVEYEGGSFSVVILLVVLEAAIHKKIREPLLDWGKRPFRNLGKIVKSPIGLIFERLKGRGRGRQSGKQNPDKQPKGPKASRDGEDQARSADEPKRPDTLEDAKDHESARRTKEEVADQQDPSGGEGKKNDEQPNGKKQVSLQARPFQHVEMYEYVEELSRCFLKEECKWQRIFYQAAVVAVLAYHFINNNASGTTMFPLYAVTEFWMMSMVPTRKEFFEKGQKQSGLEQRKDELNRTLDKISKKSPFRSGKPPVVIPLNNDVIRTPKVTVDELRQTHEDKLLNQYFSMCKKTGQRAEPLLEFPAKAILRGKSVVFSTRFYQDMDYSFYLPMLRVLQSGYHCLVVTGDQIDMRPMEDWLLNGRRNIIGDTTVWKLERLDLRGRQNYTDIGYMTAEDLGNAKIMEENSAFFAKVRLVLIVNAASLLHKQLFGIMRLRRTLHRSCTFAICNDNAVGLTDIYSHLLQTELNLVSPTTPGARRSRFIFCDEEETPNISDCRQIQLGKTFLQAGVNAVEKVYWYSRDSAPIKDIAGLCGMLESADEYDSPADQAGKLVFGVDDANCPREDFSCIIVEDEICNPAELCVQFASRGREEAVVAIFSPNYFLLNYIRNNFKKFNAVVGEIIQTFPAYCMSERNAVLQMMWNMERTRLDENDLRNICELLGQKGLEQALWPQGYIDQNVLIVKIEKYTGITGVEYYLHYEHKFESGDAVYEFWMDPLPSGTYDQKRPCCYSCASFGHKQRILNQYSKVQLMQSYLPGQVVSLGGQSYEVMGISEHEERVEMSVRRSAQCLRLRTEYHQKRKVEISREPGADYEKTYVFMGPDHASKRQLLLSRMTAKELRVRPVGYWTNSLENTEDTEQTFTQLPEEVQQQAEHTFHSKAFLCVKFIEPGNGQDGVLSSLMFSLNELFRTVYAEYQHQLLVCSPVQSDKATEELLTLESCPRGTFVTSYSHFYIVEDSEEDIGLLDSIMLHFERLLYITTKVGMYYKNGGSNDAE